MINREGTHPSDFAATPEVSACVCTYNRAAVLRRCLCSLAAQDVDPARFEVVVVDNASTDETAVVAESFANEHANMRAVAEATQGLSHARNRAFKEARAPFVAYLDDDAIAEPDWIAAILQFIEERPDAAAFGGPYFAYFDDPRPAWFGDDWGTLQHGDAVRPLGASEWLSGTNMVFRKSLLQEFGGFDPALGVIGRTLGYGEEPALQLRLKRAGHSIYYCPHQRVRHLVARCKLSPWWWLRRSFAEGKTRWDLVAGNSPPVSTEAWRVVRSLVGIGWRFFRGRKLHLVTRLILAARPFFWQLGSFVAAVQGRESAAPAAGNAAAEDRAAPSEMSGTSSEDEACDRCESGA